MHDDPSKRYPTALAFAEALEQAARGEAAAAESVTPAEPVPIAAVAPAAIPPAELEPDRIATAGDIAAAAGAAPAPVFSDEADDIAAEREEDEAHWILAKQEQLSSQIEAEEPSELFADEQVEAAADRLALDAADLALDETPPAEARFREEFEVEKEAAPVSSSLMLDLGEAMEPEPTKEAPAEPARSFIPIASASTGESRPGWPPQAPRSLHDAYDRPLAGEQSGESQIVIERTRTAMLPIAVSLMVGLPLAFAAGYIVRGREAPVAPSSTADRSEATASTGTAAPTGSGEPAPAGREWSEQAVGQPATRPAAPASAPDVPPEAPASPTAGNEAAPATPPAQRTGRIVVRSTPSKAGVTVNGTWRGRTPLTLDELTFGPYVVRVVAEGYEVGREEFRLSATDPSRTISMRLERRPVPRGRAAQPAPAPSRPAAPTAAAKGYVGTVFVDSRPQGAKVYIDGKESGTTPVRIPEVPIGSHVVRLELPDHSGWTKPIRVTAGQEVRVTGSLDPIR
jgi:hypothetical protein